jgi:pimeloyl-ACP methyl ester carboxylesterase
MARGLIQALGLRDVTLVGHSYGGHTALHLAAQNPAGIHALVIVGSRLYPPVDIDPLYKFLAVPVLGRGLAAALTPVMGSARVEEGVTLNFAPHPVPPGFVASRTPIWTRPTVTAALSEERATFEASMAQLEPLYKKISLPITLVYGEQDKTVTSAARLARELPHAKLITLPQTGHYVQYARPDELVAAIMETVARRE